MAKKDKKDTNSETSSYKKTETTTVTKKKKSNGWAIATVIIIILVAIVLLAYILYGALFVSLVSLFYSNVPLSGATLKAILLQRVDSFPMLAATYAGNLSLNGQDPNIQVSYFKYYSDTRLTYALNNIPFIGTGDITVINSTNNTQQNEICVPTSLALFSSPQISKNATYYCANSNSSNYATLVDKLNSVLNVSGATNFHINSYGLGFYNWQLCYQVAGTGTMPFNRQLIKENGIVNSTVNFNSCISAQYGIPVKLSGTIVFPDASSGSSDTLGFNLTQLNMNQTTTESEVLQLPIGNS
jgi:hypothetical protein